MPNKLKCSGSTDRHIVCNARSFKSPLLQFGAVFLPLLLLLVPGFAACDDTLQSVMARMKPESAIAIDYQETRYMSMMSDKWTGSGCFYALLPDIMIKEQFSPVKELMGIKGKELYYFNQQSGQKHQAELTEQESQIAYIDVFKGLMNGDLQSLKLLYDIEFAKHPTGWKITLTPKKNNDSEDGFKVIMQGPPEQVANKLELIMADGDHTEFLLGPASSGEAIKLKTMKLFDLLGEN